MVESTFTLTYAARNINEWKAEVTFDRHLFLRYYAISFVLRPKLKILLGDQVATSDNNNENFPSKQSRALLFINLP